MQKKYQHHLIALTSAQQFLDTNNTVLGEINATAARKLLDKATDDLRALSVSQQGAARAAQNGRQTEFKLTEALKRNFLRPIAKIANAQLPSETELGNLMVPDSHAPTMSVITVARDMANLVDAYPTVFADRGENLGPRLRAATDEVERSITGKIEHRTVRVKATKTIPQTVAHARRVVAALDTMVKAELNGADTMIDQWRNAVRVMNRGARNTTAPVTPVVTPVAGPVSAPVSAPVSTPAAEPVIAQEVKAAA
jgi:hypothetical protein